MKVVNIKGTAVSVPDNWSDNAAYIWSTKYARVIGGVKENDVTKSIDRIATSIWHPKEYPFQYEHLKDVMVKQVATFNSPVWFNLGVSKKPQCSACFILGLEDSMESITDWWKTQTFIFKQGSGIGTDLSRLRENGSVVGEDGISSGPLPFARVADTIGRATRSGGITRRAATMLTLIDSHPDICEFVTSKSKTEHLIKDLGRIGYNVSNLNSDVYDMIQNQYANRSIRLSDKFMESVLEDASWDLVSPKDGHIVRTIPARELFTLIAFSAWECGDPGVQFTDTVNSWNTIPEVGSITSSNPCSEFLFMDDSSCNLGSINVAKFYTPDIDDFDIYGLSSTTKLMIKSMDRIVDLSHYPTTKITLNTKAFRPLGLGITNLGGLLMLMGLPYDSEEGRAVAATIMAIITARAYRSSVDDCPFSFDLSPIIRKHYEHSKILANQLAEIYQKNKRFSFYQLLRNMEFQYQELIRLVDEGHVFKNTQVTLIAPTGTTSFILDAATTGVEPVYALTYEKSLVQDQNSLTIPLNCLKASLENLGYSGDDYAKIRDAVYRGGLLEGLNGYIKEEHLPVFQTAVGVNALSPEAHIKMCAAIQPFISGGISKTVNLPSTSTIQDFEKAIITCWQTGVKAIALYRDGSKSVQPHNKIVFCNGCGGIMLKTGTCYTCPKCGESSGGCSI